MVSWALRTLVSHRDCLRHTVSVSCSTFTHVPWKRRWLDSSHEDRGTVKVHRPRTLEAGL